MAARTWEARDIPHQKVAISRVNLRNRPCLKPVHSTIKSDGANGSLCLESLAFLASGKSIFKPLGLTVYFISTFKDKVWKWLPFVVQLYIFRSITFITTLTTIVNLKQITRKLYEILESKDEKNGKFKKLSKIQFLRYSISTGSILQTLKCFSFYMFYFYIIDRNIILTSR